MITLSKSVVKKSLSSHSWLGLMIGALMYLICLSGAVLVFHAELEGWEQADAPRVNKLDIARAQDSFHQILETQDQVTPHMYLVLPTDDYPYARVASETESWFLDEGGRIKQKERNDWSTMIYDLHLYLHLPKTWGMVLVSAMGAVLVGLIVSGFLAHPNIVKDAFKFRLGSSEQLAQTDVHNRLSVWASPFHLTIAITGAYFGLAIPLLAVMAESEYGGDREQLIAEIYGDEPDIPPQIGLPDLSAALEKTKLMESDATPFNIIVHETGTEHQHVAVYVQYTDRLLWSETYLFTSNGEFISREGWSDGSVGKQILYSIYRLHFGTFDGLIAKILYFLLGLSLAIVSVTGVNIWLAKRRFEDGLSDVWVSIVWGVPIALIMSAIFSLTSEVRPSIVFWVTIGIGIVMAFCVRNASTTRSFLQVGLLLLTLFLLGLHYFTFASASLTGAPLLINIGLSFLALYLAAVLVLKKQVVSGSLTSAHH